MTRLFRSRITTLWALTGTSVVAATKAGFIQVAQAGGSACNDTALV